MSDGPKHPWQSKGEAERKRILATVRTCGAHRQPWESTAALLGITARQLRNWRADDPEGKIETAYAAGKAETGTIVAEGLITLAEQMHPETLKHLSKHFLGMGDKQTTVSVDAKDAAQSKGDQRERYRQALSVLGLEALLPDESDSDAT